MIIPFQDQCSSPLFGVPLFLPLYLTQQPEGLSKQVILYHAPAEGSPVFPLCNRIQSWLLSVVGCRIWHAAWSGSTTSFTMFRHSGLVVVSSFYINSHSDWNALLLFVQAPLPITQVYLKCHHIKKEENASHDNLHTCSISSPAHWVETPWG
jgi:hypothetical protein